MLSWCGVRVFAQLTWVQISKLVLYFLMGFYDPLLVIKG